MNEEDDRNNWIEEEEEEEEEVEAIAFVRVRCNKATRARFDKTTLRNIICIRIRVSRMKKSVEVKPFSLSPSERDDTAFRIIAKMHIFSSADVLLTRD